MYFPHSPCFPTFLSWYFALPRVCGGSYFARFSNFFGFDDISSIGFEIGVLWDSPGFPIDFTVCWIQSSSILLEFLISISPHFIIVHHYRSGFQPFRLNS